jgi:mRNA interferase MazF
MANPFATKGKVVLVPFPFDDLSESKVRPAVCLTDPFPQHDHIILAFITSQASTPPLATDLELAPADPDFRATGLRVRSVLRTHRLLTLSAAVIKRELGILSPRYQALVDAKLRMVFDLA